MPSIVNTADTAKTGAGLRLNWIPLVSQLRWSGKIRQGFKAYFAGVEQLADATTEGKLHSVLGYLSPA